MTSDAPNPPPSTRNAVEDAIERAKDGVRWGQVSMPELTRKANRGGMVQCSGCNGWYEDAPGNFCSFCAP